MATFVLVAGAWLGGWAWEQTADALRERGHEPMPLTLTGLAGEPAPQANLDTHIDDIVTFVGKQDLHDVTLVGHSYGGVPVTGAAARLGNRLERVVFVDSAPFTEGMCMLDLMSPEAADQLRKRIVGGLMPMPPFDVLAQSASLDGLDDEQRALLRGRAVPHPFGTYEQPLPGPAELAPHVDRVVVVCNDFKAMLDADVPALAFIKQPPWRRYDLPTGHWPMLSAPGELAEILARAAE